MTLCAPCGVGVSCFLHDSPAADTYQPRPATQNRIDHEWWCPEDAQCECFGKPDGPPVTDTETNTRKE